MVQVDRIHLWKTRFSGRLAGDQPVRDTLVEG